MELIRRAGIETEGKNCVVLGRSNIVGKPLAMMLAQKGPDIKNAHILIKYGMYMCRIMFLWLKEHLDNNSVKSAYFRHALLFESPNCKDTKNN